MKTTTVAICRTCGPLEVVGRRSLDSSAELHTKTTGHLTVVITTPLP